MKTLGPPISGAILLTMASFVPIGARRRHIRGRNASAPYASTAMSLFRVWSSIWGDHPAHVATTDIERRAAKPS